MTTRKSNGISMTVAATAMLSLLGCSPPPGATSGNTQPEPTGGQPDPTDDTGDVTFALTTTPSTVQCIRINANINWGNTTTSKTFAVTAGSSTASLAFGTVPSGYAWFTGDAFDVACASIGTASPSWSSDTATTTITPGMSTTIPLTFRRNYSVTTSVNFAHTIKSVTAGYVTTYATTEVGPYWWGSLPQSKAPVAVPVLTDAVKVVSGYAHSCALRNDGTVWCWGDNSNGAVGNGIPMGSFTSNPVQVTGLSNVALLTAGDYHTCAWPQPPNLQTGPIYCWGGNWAGQLGNGTAASSTPLVVGSYYGLFKQLAAGSQHTLALNSSGSLIGWGGNSYGQIGGGLATTSTPLTSVPNVTGAVSIGAGSWHSCALHADGSAQCWGWNGSGQVGDGTTTMRVSPTWVTSLPGAIRQLSSGGSANCGVLTDGRITCWGEDASGQLGNNSATASSYPVINTMMPDVGLTVSMGVYHGCALTPALDIYCWGGNGSGQLGDGTQNNAFSPVKVVLP